MEISLLNDIIIFGLSIAVLFLCHRFRIFTIVGYLMTGILAGPHGLGLIDGVHEVEMLAEIGVVLLLFAIGIEFSLKNLVRIRRSALIGEPIQLEIKHFVPMTYLSSLARQIELSLSQICFMIWKKLSKINLSPVPETH